MKIGDAVKFIGFDGYRQNPKYENKPGNVGIIVAVHTVRGKNRYDVSWPNGTFGNWLYPETLEVISES